MKTGTVGILARGKWLDEQFNLEGCLEQPCLPLTCLPFFTCNSRKKRVIFAAGSARSRTLKDLPLPKKHSCLLWLLRLCPSRHANECGVCPLLPILERQNRCPTRQLEFSRRFLLEKSIRPKTVLWCLKHLSGQLLTPFCALRICSQKLPRAGAAQIQKLYPNRSRSLKVYCSCCKRTLSYFLSAFRKKQLNS